MFLCDTNIKEKLPELRIEVDGPDYPFQPDQRIQPASIDLSLSNVFWKPKRRYAKNRFFFLDLRSGSINDISPRRYWRRNSLRDGETITLRPGDILLGRTHEEFSIPADCAGLIFGRSSFARIGLSISCVGLFLNPQYRGHMPLQLVNHGPFKIKIIPYLPICQLALVKLTGIPEKPYGHPDLQSKYMNDDGGPSYWWRDSRVRDVIAKMTRRDVSLDKVQRISKLISEKDLSIIDRLESFLLKAPIERLSVEDILTKFSNSEKRRTIVRHILKYVCVMGLPLSLAIVGFLLRSSIESGKLSAIIASIMLVLMGITATLFGYFFDIGPHLSAVEAEAMLESDE